MPALNGQIISTLTDETGAPVFVIHEFYDPVTYALRNATQATSRGNQTGALIVDNMTGRGQQVTVTNSDTGAVRTFNISPNGAALTVAQLAAQSPPITTIQDLAGIQPSVT
jgi:hypothetical protein